MEGEKLRVVDERTGKRMTVMTWDLRNAEQQALFKKIAAMDKDGTGEIGVGDLASVMTEQMELKCQNRLLKWAVVGLVIGIAGLFMVTFGSALVAGEMNKETHVESGRLIGKDGMVVTTKNDDMKVEERRLKGKDGEVVIPKNEGGGAARPPRHTPGRRPPAPESADGGRHHLRFLAAPTPARRRG